MHRHLPDPVDNVTVVLSGPDELSPDQSSLRRTPLS
jgi:hypothetical protein